MLIKEKALVGVFSEYCENFREISFTYQMKTCVPAPIFSRRGHTGQRAGEGGSVMNWLRWKNESIGHNFSK